MTAYRSAPVTVLVVEDEPLILFASLDFVASAGFEVMEAGNASQALAVMESNPQIAILFTDVDMPGAMDGIGLAYEVFARWPHVHIFITSGHVDTSKTALPAGAQFFSKPINEMKVSDAMWQRIESARPS